MKRGDVVLVVASGDLGKPRPAIVVQSNDLGDATTTVLICPTSSEVGQPSRLRPLIEPTPGNSLQVPSHIMTDKITALQRTRIRRVLGELDPQSMDDLDRALIAVLGLTP